MVYLLVFGLELLMFAETARRLHLASAALMTFGYIIVAQTFFLYSSFTFSGSSFAAGSLGTFYYSPAFGILFYGALYAFIYAATFGVQQDKSLNYQRLSEIKLKKISKILYLLMLLTLVIRMGTIDFGVLWSNNTYLLIGSSEGMRIGGAIPELAKSSLGLLGVLVAALATANYLKGNSGAAILGFLMVVPSLLISLASASRSSGMIFVAIAISLLLFGSSPRHRLVAVAAFCICVLMFVTALHGRSTGTFGIAAIPTHFTLSDAARDVPIWRIFIGSVVQGIFVTTDSIRLDAEFSDIYKILSFSPFPSSIDGFESIRTSHQVRLHRYVPMSAIGEVYHFGLLYILIYGLTLFLLYRGNAKLDASKTPVKLLATSVFITLFFIVAQAYPMRNTYRQLLIALLLLNYETIFRPARRFLVKASRSGARA